MRCNTDIVKKYCFIKYLYSSRTLYNLLCGNESVIYVFMNMYRMNCSDTLFLKIYLWKFIHI